MAGWRRSRWPRSGWPAAARAAATAAAAKNGPPWARFAPWRAGRPASPAWAVLKAPAGAPAAPGPGQGQRLLRLLLVHPPAAGLPAQASPAGWAARRAEAAPRPGPAGQRLGLRWQFGVGPQTAS